MSSSEPASASCRLWTPPQATSTRSFPTIPSCANAAARLGQIYSDDGRTAESHQTTPIRGRAMGAHGRQARSENTVRPQRFRKRHPKLCKQGSESPPRRQRWPIKSKSWSRPLDTLHTAIHYGYCLMELKDPKDIEQTEKTYHQALAALGPADRTTLVAEYSYSWVLRFGAP